MNLDLATPTPLAELREHLGDGQTVYAPDAVHPAVLWTLTGPQGPVILAAYVTADNRVTSMSLTSAR